MAKTVTKKTAETTPAENGETTSTKKTPRKRRRGKPTSSNSSPQKKKAPRKGVRPKKKGEVVYDSYNVIPHWKGSPLGPLTAEGAKETLGWTEETEDGQFGRDYQFKDTRGRKIRCSNNLTNRGFHIGLAIEWMNEVLHGHWAMCGEPWIIDRTGMVQDGQHRLAGLVFAAQSVADNPGKYPVWNESPPTMEGYFVVGISEKDDTVNKIGTGKPRSLSDVIYRSAIFAGIPSKDRAQLANSMSFAIRMLWERTKQGEEFPKPGRSHSEFLEFLERHPKLKDCVKHIWEENGGSKARLSKLIRPGTSSGLLYLMGSSASEWDDYLETNDESRLDWKRWDKACDFWTELAAGAEALAPLRQALLDIDEDSPGGAGIVQAEKNGTVTKAWRLYSRGKPVTAAGIRCLMTSDAFGNPILAEYPRVGGIDMIDEGEIEEDDEE